jgi:predicted AAA+ superfamily ATPase
MIIRSTCSNAGSSSPKRPTTSFFLWGPRQTGKSSLLRATYPTALTIDLLGSREFSRYTRDPGTFREEVLAARARWVVVDEVQKVPALLDEVHWLIENQRVAFALCGTRVAIAGGRVPIASLNGELLVDEIYRASAIAPRS